MAKKSASTERRRNLWAPWRTEYIQALSSAEGAGEGGGKEGCFLCRYRRQPRSDRKNLVLWRGPRTLTVLNRFPYTGGHSMVAPLQHVGGLGDLDEPTMLEMLAVLRDLPRVLTAAIGAEGFNIGINLGRCAGAGLPGHLHAHVVPRWSGDTNFMAVFGDVRVIPQSLESLYDAIRQAARELGLPAISKGK
jgi:ATP adenylyltransferase